MLCDTNLSSNVDFKYSILSTFFKFLECLLPVPSKLEQFTSGGFVTVKIFSNQNVFRKNNIFVIHMCVHFPIIWKRRIYLKDLSYSKCSLSSCLFLKKIIFFGRATKGKTEILCCNFVIDFHSSLFIPLGSMEYLSHSHHQMNNESKIYTTFVKLCSQSLSVDFNLFFPLTGKISTFW